MLSVLLASVIINEVAWMGTEVSPNDEWIELYNPTAETIVLDNWTLISQDGSPSITLGGVIAAEGFYLLERTDDTSNPNKTADLIYKGALNNTGEYLKLYDSSNNLVDEIDCSEGWTSGDNETKETFKRTKPSEAAPPNIPPEIVKEEPEPLYDYPSNIVFVRIMPSPEGEDSKEEYIEIKNNNDFEVDLKGWVVKDKTGSIKEYTLNQKIPPKEILTLKRPETKITLNNSGDGLELLNPEGRIADSVDFDKAQTGVAFIKTSGVWGWDIPEQKSSETKPATKSSPSLAQANLEKQGIEIDLTEENPKSNLSLVLTGLLTALISGIIFIIFKKKLFEDY